VRDGELGEVDAVIPGDARGRRRDNGLVAPEYAAAGDVDPRVGEHLLDVLALEGIAAYLRPSTDLHPVTRSSTLPGRPTDRLYVDRDHLATARGHLAHLAEDIREADVDAAGMTAGTDDVDAAWAKIVAGFDAEVEPPVQSWPAAEEAPETGPDKGGPAVSRLPPLRGARALPRADPSDEPSLLDGLETFGADLPDPDDEGYTPPAPPPLPRPSMPAALGIAGIVGGLIIFLRPNLLPMGQGIALLAGFAAIVAGFVTLIGRLRPGDDEEDDPDDGARV